MQFVDAVSVTGTRRTADGYLIANARSVRVGIQLYAGFEVGVADKAMVRVYRPPDEVFDQESLQSFSHAPVTIDHPAEPVTAANWKRLSVGEVSTAAQKDGEWVSLPLILKDAAAIAGVDSGKRQLSAGYVCKLDRTPGTTPGGEPYDAVQRDIRINHLALVDTARAGPRACIGDSWAAPETEARSDLGATPPSENIHNDRSPSMKTLVIDGHTVALDDAAFIAVSNLNKTIGTLTADNLSLTAKVTTATADAVKAVEAKDGEILKLQADHKVADEAKDKIIADLQAQAITADKLDAAVAERSAVLDAAKPVLGADYDPKGKTVADIRRATVAKRLGDKAVEGKADEHVAIAFDTLTAVLPADPLGRVLGDSVPQPRHQTGNIVQMGDAATEYAAMRARDANAWKKEA